MTSSSYIRSSVIAQNIFSKYCRATRAFIVLLLGGENGRERVPLNVHIVGSYRYMLRLLYIQHRHTMREKKESWVIYYYTRIYS